jgi:rhodanese-related sulfurtransferase
MNLFSTSLGRRRFGLLLTAAALLPTQPVRAADDPDAVSLETARAELAAGRAVVIDVREPSEHATGIAAGARLLPMSQLNARIGEIPVDPRKPVFLMCHTQNRSSAILRTLRQRGYAHVRYVNGGMSEWARRGWPMVKPPA